MGGLIWEMMSRNKCGQKRIRRGGVQIRRDGWNRRGVESRERWSRRWRRFGRLCGVWHGTSGLSILRGRGCSIFGSLDGISYRRWKGFECGITQPVHRASGISHRWGPRKERCCNGRLPSRSTRVTLRALKTGDTTSSGPTEGAFASRVVH